MTTATLTFTQADGNASGWSSIGYPLPQVVSNQLRHAYNAPAGGASAGTYAIGFDIQANGSLEYTYSANDGGLYMLLVNASLNGYGIRYGTAGGLRLVRMDGGTDADISTPSGSGTVTGDVLKYVKSGTNHKLYKNGVEQASVTESTYTTTLASVNILAVLTDGTTAGVITVDDLTYSNDAPGGSGFVAPKLITPRGAVRRSRSW